MERKPCAPNAIDPQAIPPSVGTVAQLGAILKPTAMKKEVAYVGSNRFWGSCSGPPAVTENMTKRFD